eukprot:454638-Prorocentrum_minimum.AAC.1
MFTLVYGPSAPPPLPPSAPKLRCGEHLTPDSPLARIIRKGISLLLNSPLLPPAIEHLAILACRLTCGGMVCVSDGARGRRRQPPPPEERSGGGGGGGGGG